MDYRKRAALVVDDENRIRRWRGWPILGAATYGRCKCSQREKETKERVGSGESGISQGQRSARIASSESGVRQ